MKLIDIDRTSLMVYKMNETLPKGKNSYKLNPHNYCRIINDRVKCASLIRSNYSKEVPLDFIPVEKPKFENRPCGKPYLIVKKWKHWIFFPKTIKNPKKCKTASFLPLTKY